MPLPPKTTTFGVRPITQVPSYNTPKGADVNSKKLAAKQRAFEYYNKQTGKIDLGAHLSQYLKGTHGAGKGTSGLHQFPQAGSTLAGEAHQHHLEGHLRAMAEKGVQVGDSKKTAVNNPHIKQLMESKGDGGHPPLCICKYAGTLHTPRNDRSGQPAKRSARWTCSVL